MKIFKNIGLSILSLVFFFLIVEGGFKILHILSDPEVGESDIEGLPYENTPNGWFLRYSHSRGWIFYKNNSHGMRDVERVFKKPDGVKRVICLGDSIVFGGEVRFNKIFSRQLEGFLQEDLGAKVQVLNCGTTSYSLREYLIYLKKKAINFSPDMLIIGLCLNDHSTYFPEEDKGEMSSGIKNDAKTENRYHVILGKAKRFLFHSYFIEYIEEAIKTLKDMGYVKEDEGYRISMATDVWVNTRKYFLEIRNICHEYDIPMLVIIFPASDQLRGDYSMDMQPQKFIRDMLGPLDIEYIDMLPIYADAKVRGNKIYTRFDRLHPLSIGHELAAQAVRRKIINENLLK